MSGGEWAASCIAGLIFLAGIFGVVYEWAYDRGRIRGYRVGQQAERQASAQRFDELKQKLDGFKDRGLAAQRDIDYLYEQAHWQIQQSSDGTS
jgi:hypothetical protein